ncbi:hypothetical protein D9619_013645 [Psilocybe cf. subviscida]|uniref:Uncharacterized protein n=1 Tax=Psilocybe cf. subviscida TaxID=2480587 RepID=A0A8H5BS58_9AGAR|nr:hypothetical protein D9619_013645 [Psilocybe cf. subviscida]
MKFTSVFAMIGACVVAAHAATVATLLNDIAVIGSGASKIDALVQAYPEKNGTVAGAQDIHNAAAALVTPIKNATANARTIAPIPVSDADATSIVAALNRIRPPIRRHLPRLTFLLPTFAALPVKGVPTIILQDLITLNQSTAAFRASVNAIVPKSFLNQTEDFFKAVASDFNATIAAYSA